MPRILRILAILSLIALVGACSSNPKSSEAPTMPQQPAVAKAPEMSPPDRAKIHTELAAGYWHSTGLL